MSLAFLVLLLSSGVLALPFYDDAEFLKLLDNVGSNGITFEDVLQWILVNKNISLPRDVDEVLLPAGTDVLLMSVG